MGLIWWTMVSNPQHSSHINQQSSIFYAQIHTLGMMANYSSAQLQGHVKSSMTGYAQGCQ